MKRIIFLTMFLLGLALATPVVAQPMAVTKPAAMAAVPSAMVVAPIKPVVAAMTAPAVVAPMTAAPAKAAESPEPTPEWKTASFWISKVALPLILFILGLGWLKKSWLLWLKEKGIVVVADKVANGFEAYTKGTPAAWDDAVAMALKAVVARFGKLTPKQEAKVKAVVKERQGQAEKKNGDG